MKEEEEKYNLPRGWANVTLGDILVLEYGKSLPKDRRQDGKYPVFGSNGVIGYHNNFLLDGPVIIIGRKGSVGSVHISDESCWPIDTTYFIKTFSSLDLKFIFYFLKYSNLSQLDKSTTIPGLNRENVYKKKIALPTLSEQKAIVSQIDVLYSKLDEAEKGLKAANSSLKIYRKALLNEAFTGKLTNKNIADGEYPQQWKMVKISSISNVVRGGSPRPAGDLRYYDGNIPFLKVKDLTNDEKVHLTTYEYTIKEAGLAKTRKIEPETLLLSNSGATLGIPKICLIDSTINDGIAAFLDLDKRSMYYLYYFFLLNTQKLRDISMGATQPNLNTTIIKNIELPYCSFYEQKQIVEIIESRFTLVDNLEKTVESVLNEITALKHSILKKAFEGTLVTFNSFESIEKLLNDIKEEKRLYLKARKDLNRITPPQKKKMEEKKSILDILKESSSPISAQELWERSTSEGDIERFYSEIKEIYNQIDELKSKTESLLALKDENK